MTGQKLGNYEVLDKLGEGGMGEVWRARDARLNRTVAVKVLPMDLAGDASRRQRFEQEAKSLAALNHPNIVAVYDIGQSEGQSYIVSELVDGESLRKVIERGPLSSRKLLDIANQIAEGMAAAHALSIIHRDLKPENIMLTGAGRVKILDFGLAKQRLASNQTDETRTIALSQPGIVLGTMGYMSPEQVRGEMVDARSDIFSFGCVLYEMATGQRAFRGKSTADVISAILKEEPPEISPMMGPTPQALDAIVRRCLEKDPAQRFQSAADLAFALRSAYGATSTQPAMAAVTPPRRRSFAKPALGILAALALLAAGYLIHGRDTVVSAPEFQKLTFREGHIEGARFGPEGQNVLYAADWDGAPRRLFLGIAGNPEARDLGAPVNSWLLSVSSKGDLAMLDGPFRPDGSGTLSRGSLAGGQNRELLQDVRLADWSPDGSEMALVRMVNGKSRLEFPAGKALLESEFGPHSIRVSPDGKLVAFTLYGGGRRIAIHTVDRDGKHENIAFVSGQNPTLDNPVLCWTADGREIWFRSFDPNQRNTIYAVNLKGQVRMVGRFPGRIALYDLAKNGDLLLATDSGRQGIRGVAPGEKAERDLSCLQSSALRGISADGRLILADIEGEGGGSKGSIYLRKTDGSPAVRLGDGVSIGLSPDGQWVSGYTSADAANRKFMLLPTGPGEQIDLSFATLQMRTGLVVGWLSGDRNYLVLGSLPGKKLQFFAWDAAAGTLRPLTPEGVSDQIPLVSSDGKQFLATGPQGDPRIYYLDGRESVHVTGLSPHDIPIGWKSDGRSVYIAVHRDENRIIPVFLLDTKTANRTPWKEIQADIPVDQIHNVRITPDGKAYAYNYSYTRSELYLARGLH